LGPGRTEESLRGLRERLSAKLICRDGLDQRSPIEPTIGIKQSTPLGDQVGVSEIKRTVEIPKVRVTKILENREGVTHRSSWRRSAAATMAMVYETPE
jgi:hypothetical protein